MIKLTKLAAVPVCGALRVRDHLSRQTESFGKRPTCAPAAPQLAQFCFWENNAIGLGWLAHATAGWE
jgi:hypothetical protein